MDLFCTMRNPFADILLTFIVHKRSQKICSYFDLIQIKNVSAHTRQTTVIVQPWYNTYRIHFGTCL